MQRFKKYVGEKISLAKIKDAAGIGSFGMTCRYLPDPPEDFDEFEFVTDFGGKNNLGLMVTIELMRIKRLFFGMISPEDPDVIRALNESELEQLLKERGAQLEGFFHYIIS
jgi:hypothetical protein